VAIKIFKEMALLSSGLPCYVQHDVENVVWQKKGRMQGRQ
jgi:hypothetical protein